MKRIFNSIFITVFFIFGCETSSRAGSNKQKDNPIDNPLSTWNTLYQKDFLCFKPIISKRNICWC